MRRIERRIARLEILQRRQRESGPSPAEMIRERRRKRLLENGMQPEPPRPPIPCVDERGRPLTIGEIIRRRRFGQPRWELPDGSL